MINYGINNYRRGRIAAMHKTNLFVCFIVVIVLSGCSQLSNTKLYQQILDYSLQDDLDLKKVDYISLYINDDHLSQRKLTSLERYLQDKYDKHTFSYMAEEFRKSGPYGKEDLNQEGIYVYITEVKNQKDRTVVFIEKYSTLKRTEAIGLKMTFSKTKQSWKLDEKKVEWEEGDTSEENDGT